VIFGTCENITPAVLANKSTSIIEEETETRKESCKKQKGKSNVKVMSIAIVEMNQSRERIWEQKMILEKEKMVLEKEKTEKSHELERVRMEAEKEKWAYEKEKTIAEREQAKMEFELRMKELELRYQKRD